MRTELINKIVIIIGAIIAMIVFLIKLLMGSDVVSAAYLALWVLVIVSIILVITFQSIAHILFKHLADQQRDVLEHELQDAVDIESNSMEEPPPVNETRRRRRRPDGEQQ